MEIDTIEAVLSPALDLPVDVQTGRAIKLFEEADRYIKSGLSETRKRLASRMLGAKANARRLAKAAAALELQRELAAKLSTLSQQLTAIEQAYAKRYEEQVWQLALDVASDLARKEIETNPESVKARIKEALHSFGATCEPIAIHVHPLQKAVIENSISSTLKVVASANIALGNAKIELGVGAIEIDWYQHLTEIKERRLHATT